MNRTDDLSITIRLQPAVHGDRVHVEGVAQIAGDEHEFSGWMALLDVLETAVERTVAPEPSV